MGAEAGGVAVGDDNRLLMGDGRSLPTFSGSGQANSP